MPQVVHFCLWVTGMLGTHIVLRHLAIKSIFERLGHISPFFPKQCVFFYFFECTDHSAYTTLNWGAGGIRELTLDANKLEQVLNYRKASFPKSVCTTLVAHCRISGHGAFGLIVMFLRRQHCFFEGKDLIECCKALGKVNYLLFTARRQK